MTIFRTAFFGCMLALGFSTVGCGHPSCDADGHAELTPFAVPTAICDNGTTCRVNVHTTRPTEVVCNAAEVKGATCTIGGPFCFSDFDTKDLSQFSWTGVAPPVRVRSEANAMFGAGCCKNLVVKFD